MYFEKKKITLIEHITELAKTDTTNLAYDETIDNNLRYIGSNPNNYVTFNNELWRIIGVMNNVSDETGLEKSRIKLIRNESIGEFSWDTTNSTTNNGYGTNEWSSADIMRLMNPGYESYEIGGSLYWNKQNGSCYTSINNGSSACDFTNIGLSSEARSMISQIVWQTGSTGPDGGYSNILTQNFYELERSNNLSQNCTDSCDTWVNKTAKWTGYIGLPYPSDYGYATSGGNTTDRNTCLNTILNNWSNADKNDCKTNNWLYKSKEYIWTITPGNDSGYIDGYLPQYYITSTGAVAIGDPYMTNPIYPTLYLNYEIKVISGDGSSENPFIIGNN